jgi:single-stranded DNA-binding protein
MPQLNSCNLIGHLGKDVEAKVTQNGKTIVKLSLAVNSGYGENKKTVWTVVSVFGKQAEWLAKDGGRKGDLCIIHGAEYRVDEVEKDGEKQRYHGFAIGGIGQDCWIMPSRKRDDEDRQQELGERQSEAQKEDTTPEPEEDGFELPF